MGGAINAQKPEKYLGKLWQRAAEGGMAVRVKQSYWKKGTSLCRMEYYRGVTTPAECDSTPVEDEMPELTQRLTQRYQTTVGGVTWAANERPNLAYVAEESARHLHYFAEKDHQKLR